MIELLKSILKECNVLKYKIIEQTIDSAELFLIRKNLDFTRGKNVTKYKVSVYKDFEEEGKKFTGSSDVDIFPTMTKEEIVKNIKSSLYAAEFVKNEFYELPKGKQVDNIIIENTFSGDTLEDMAFKIRDVLYTKDTFEKGFINSSEIFIYKIRKRIINSEGIDVSYEKVYSDIEFITQWIENQDVELYNFISCMGLDKNYLEEKVKESLNKTKLRDEAKTKVPNGKYKVILCENDLKTFIMNYYVSGANTNNIYNKVSKFKLNESVQGKNIKGDYLNIELTPVLNNSKASEIYDDDGIELKNLQLIKDGVLKNYYGDNRTCQYLNIEPTGIISNAIVQCGSKSIEDMKKEVGILILAFSDFQMDDLTGDFAGEVRLALYNDGKNIIPVTGGSISANVKDVEENFKLSKENYITTSYDGPMAIELNSICFSGE